MPRSYSWLRGILLTLFFKMSTQELNDKIASIRLIHYLERDLHYPNDEFVELFSQENGLTEESRDIVLNDNISTDDLIQQYKLDFMGLPKPITNYLLEADEIDKNYRLVNRERHNKAIILYIAGNRKPMVTRANTHKEIVPQLDIGDPIVIEDTFANSKVEDVSPSAPLVSTHKESIDTKTTQTLTLSKKPRKPKPARLTYDPDDYSNIEKKFKKVNKIKTKKKVFRGRDF